MSSPHSKLRFLRARYRVRLNVREIAYSPMGTDEPSDHVVRSENRVRARWMDSPGSLGVCDVHRVSS